MVSPTMVFDCFSLAFRKSLVSSRNFRASAHHVSRSVLYDVV